MLTRDLHLASTLQAELVEDLKKTFAGMKLKSSKGTFMAPNVYSQRLPLTMDDDEDELNYAPYVIVALSDFKIEDWCSDKKITVVLILCTYDAGENRSGDRECHLIMDKVLERFGKNPHIGNFDLVMPIEGAWQEKDTYPFFFGAMELNFTSIKHITEDILV